MPDYEWKLELLDIEGLYNKIANQVEIKEGAFKMIISALGKRGLSQESADVKPVNRYIRGVVLRAKKA